MSAAQQVRPPRRRTAAPFRLTRAVTAEVDLHAAVAHALSILLLPSTPWTTLPIGHIKLDGQQAAKFARLGVARNFPDILLFHDDHSFGLELKRSGGTLSKTRLVPTRAGGKRLVEGQAEGFARLEAQGVRIAVVDSVDAAIAALQAWGVPLRIAREWPP